MFDWFIYICWNSINHETFGDSSCPWTHPKLSCWAVAPLKPLGHPDITWHWWPIGGLLFNCVLRQMRQTCHWWLKVPLPSRDASCMLRAAWPIYNVDLESVKQLSSHPLLSSGSDKITLLPCCHLSMPTERTVSRTTKPCDWAFKTLPDLETHVL